MPARTKQEQAVIEAFGALQLQVAMLSAENHELKEQLASLKKADAQPAGLSLVANDK